MAILNVSGSAVSAHVVGQSEAQKKHDYPILRSRVVPISLFKAINDCRVDMKAFFKNIGFGSLHGISIGDLHGRLGHFAVKSFDCDDFCMKLNHGSIKVDSQRVHDMLGIPMGGTPLLSLEETEHDMFAKDWLAQFDEMNPKKIRATHIAEKIVNATNIDFTFKMNFLMLITNTLAKNETKNGDISFHVLKHVREDTPVQSIDWCGYILDSLKGSKVPSVGCYYNGPLLFLTLLYLDSTKFESMSYVRSRPAIKDWNSSLMMKRVELEIKQGILGDLELQGEWTQEEARSIEGSLNVGEQHNDLSRPSFELAPTDQEGFYKKIEAKNSIISDEKKDLEDTLKQFRELFPDEDKLADFNKRCAEMFKFGKERDDRANEYVEDSISQDYAKDSGGDDGDAEGSGEDGKDGKVTNVEEAHGSACVDNEGNTTKEKVDGKFEEAKCSGGQGDVEGSARKSRRGRIIKKTKPFSPVPKKGKQPTVAKKGKQPKRK